MDNVDFDLDFIIDRMQDAVDIVLSSEHETSKVAACLFHPDGDLAKKNARTNHRPDILVKHFDMDQRIGKSSQFVHAETACVLEYEGSANGYYLCVTDPFCPNCAKTIVESGVTHVFIDHKGMEKDFVKRRAGAFQQISLKIAEAAGVHVYVLSRKDRILEALIQPTFDNSNDKKDKAVLELPLPDTLYHLDASGILQHYIKKHDEIMPSWLTNAHAICVVCNKEGTRILLVAAEALTVGLDDAAISHIIPDDTDKYRFDVDPLNKLYLTLKRREYMLQDGVILSNHRPSSRSLVNGVLANIQKIIMCDFIKGHDPLAVDAQRVMEKIKAIKFQKIDV